MTPLALSKWADSGEELMEKLCGRGGGPEPLDATDREPPASAARVLGRETAGL